MRIIVAADHALAEGGAPQVAIASAIGLADEGHDVVYLHAVGLAGDPALDSHPNIRRIGLGETDIWNKPALSAARDGIWNRDVQGPLAEVLKEIRTGETIVHAHQWTKGFSPSLFAVIREAGIPLVISLHDYFLACPTGLMYRFDQNAPCTLAPLSPSCVIAPCDPRSRLHKAIRVLRTVATGRALKGADCTLIHVSEVGRATIGRFLPAGVRQVVLANPVEVADCGLRDAPVGGKIVYCGRLTKEKGALLVAEAARAAGIGSLFIGDGPMRPDILRIDPEAEITGWIDRSKVRDIIAARALALVAPSLWPETGPLVVAEAMSAGVPAIVSERAGASGSVRHGETGLVIAPTLAALSAALATLRQSDAARRMGEAAYREYWRSPPSLAAHARALGRIYADAFARRAG